MVTTAQVDRYTSDVLYTTLNTHATKRLACSINHLQGSSSLGTHAGLVSDLLVDLLGQ